MQEIIITNQNKVNKVLDYIKSAGAQNLHVIADFDNTLTKAYENGKKLPSLVAQIREGGFLTPDYPKRAFALFDEYYPIEQDINVDPKFKKTKMLEWWTKAFALQIECGLSKKVLEEIVEKGQMVFRKNCGEFFQMLFSKNIPLIIMSGSMTDLIQMHLEKEYRIYSNIHILANKYIFDKNGFAVGVEKPIIHSANKHEILIQEFPEHDIIASRKNVILLGDSINDIGMIDGFEYENLIKIGFLNDNIEDNLEKYKENYDIVITNDAGMDYINALIKDIT